MTAATVQLHPVLRVGSLDFGVRVLAALTEALADPAVVDGSPDTVSIEIPQGPIVDVDPRSAGVVIRAGSEPGAFEVCNCVVVDGLHVDNGVQRLGALEIDRRRRRITVNGAEVLLTKREYSLLLALAADPGRVCTKDDLTREVWHFEPDGARVVDPHACRLRAKLSVGDDRFVENVWGVGYRLVPEKADDAR